MNGVHGMTSPNPDWALIIHANSSGTSVDVYWVDINAGREGLRLAREVKEWRRRDDLLTLGQRLRPVMKISGHLDASDQWVDDIKSLAQSVPVPDGPNVPPLAPVGPPETTREGSRSEHLRGRVGAIRDHGDVASFALQRGWPKGIPGLKQGGHSMDQLDLIEEAIMKVEKEHSLPFHTPWDDPDRPTVVEHHPSFSDKWAKPSVGELPTEPERESIQQGLMNHKRSALLRKWVGMAVASGINHDNDTFALAHALFEFASVDEAEWPDDDLTLMLDGSLRAIGYVNGCNDLGRFNPDHAPLLMSAAFAIAAGNAMLLFDENENPVVRVNVKGTQ